MGNCKIINCKTKRGEKSFFYVPHEAVLRKKWAQQIEQHQQFDDVPISYPICELHFDSTKINRVGKRCTLSKGTLPTMFPDVDGNYYVVHPIIEPEAEVMFSEALHVEADLSMPCDSNGSISKTEKSKQNRSKVQKENERPNAAVGHHNQPERLVTIGSTEYNRLLQSEIQLIKFKALCQKKALELKRTQDQLAYYRRQSFKRSNEVQLTESEESSATIPDEEMEIILDCLAFGKDQKSYDEVIRSFCLTVHFYSPRAYSYIRSKFNNNLPSISTIRNWYSGLNASPGFTTEAIEVLRKKSEEVKERGGPDKMLIVNLMCDEMLIRRHVQWNHIKMKFDGFIDMGRPLAQGTLPVAKDALVFMISGVEEDFKIPIGYFFSNGLNADERAALTNEAIIRLHGAGLDVLSLIFDGLPANIASCRLLGADFDNDKAYFPHPVKIHHKIFVILDVPHMLKLARNSIAAKDLIDGDGGLVQWTYFKLLHETQKSLPFNLANKITKEHIDFERKKMNVRLAAEILSNSVADSMEFLKAEKVEFEHVDATVKYIRIINDIFDIMNSTTSERATGFKRVISPSTSESFFQRFDEAKQYFCTLKVQDERENALDGQTISIFSAGIHTAFLGFYNNMVNFEKIYEEYVQTGILDVLVTHRFSQDLLESFFGAVRSMGGFNDNPTTQQFEAAYRKLLVHNDVVCSKKSNCIDPGTKILSVSSRKKSVNNATDATDQCDDDDNFFNEEFEKHFNAAAQYVDDAHSHTLAFMASVLETKIIRAVAPRLIVKCQQCIDAFVENELMEDSFIRFKARATNITQPCKSTYDVCRFVENFLKQCEGKNISFQSATIEILRKISFENLYATTNFETHSEHGHKYTFVKQIVHLYLKSKSVQLAKSMTSKEHDDLPSRNYYKKLVQQLGE